MTQTSKADLKDIPISCTLDREAFKQRRAGFEDLFSFLEEVSELPDGFSFRFPGTRDIAGRLVDFIAGERECCRFFAFQLSFGQEMGPICLEIRGGPGVKDFIMETGWSSNSVNSRVPEAGHSD